MKPNSWVSSKPSKRDPEGANENEGVLRRINSDISINKSRRKSDGEKDNGTLVSGIASMRTTSFLVLTPQRHAQIATMRDLSNRKFFQPSKREEISSPTTT